MAETKSRNRRYVRTFTTQLEKAGDEFMRAWRKQAKRPDRFGEVSYRGLELVHGGVEFTVRSLTRLEQATQVPHRTVRRHPEPPAVEAETETRRPGRSAPAHHAATPPRHHEPKPAEPKAAAS